MKESHLSLRVCTYIVLGCFLAYLALGIAMLFDPSPTMYRNGMIINGLFTFFALVHATATAMHLYKPFYNPSSLSRRYRKSLGYTILSSLLAMIAGLILYPTSMLLPAVAIMTIPWRNTFANITTDNPPKCFIADWAGGFTHGEPLCSAIPSDRVLRDHNCSCVDMWAPTKHGLADDYWGEVSYRILEPGVNLMVNDTAATFVLQLSSTYNSSRFPEGYQISAPMLTVLLYDRNISLLDAFQNERGTRTIIDAHGSTIISITPEYHIGFGRDPYYLYTSVSTGPITSLNMICDMAQPHQRNDSCYFTLHIRFTSMNRLEVRKQKMMRPPDVFVEFGAYYAFFQFVAWLLAGMAMANA